LQVIIEKDAKLLVVDSVASLVRHEFNSSTLASRQAELTKEAQTLKYLAETFKMPVVVTNQVASVGYGSSPGDPSPGALLAR
jgi:RecA/RadA recombinase